MIQENYELPANMKDKGFSTMKEEILKQEDIERWIGKEGFEKFMKGLAETYTTEQIWILIHWWEK